MKEYIVRIPEESEEILTVVIEKFGAEIEPVNESLSGKKMGKKKAAKKEKESDVSPTYLFGAWRDLDIDPDKLRQQAWERNPEF